MCQPPARLVATSSTMGSTGGASRDGAHGNPRRRLTWDGLSLLVVQTGPEHAANRAFYLPRGFLPAAELDLYPDNPIQLMSRRL